AGEGAGEAAFAGAEAGTRTADALRAALPRAEVYEPGPGDDLAQVVGEAASRAKVLAVAGGDGAVSRVAGQALRTAVPLLVVPSGPPGDFARALGLLTVDDAVDAYRSGDLVTVDVGEAAGRPFVGSASLGIYPEVLARRQRRQGRIGKWPALLWAMAEVLGPGGARPPTSSWTACRADSGWSSWATAATRCAGRRPRGANGWRTACWTCGS
ncbi:diacylglycerol/lipid kinase family protein, partial [Planomonospora algeriensis]